MEPKGSCLYSQEPATGPCSEPDAASPYLFHPISLRSILILSWHLQLGLLSFIFPSGFQNKIVFASHVWYMPYPSHKPWHHNPYNILWSVQVNEAPHYSHFQLPATSSLLGPNILISTMFSDVLIPFMWEIKFHTCTKQQVKLQFYFNLSFWRGDRKTNDTELSGNKGKVVPVL